MYVGIDISKNKSSVCVLDKQLKVVKKFDVEHNKKGFEKLEQNLSPEMKIGMETTGNYCRVVYKHLSDKSYNVAYVDNIQMNNFAKLNSPTIKNDNVDAKLIAKFLHYDYKRINPIRIDELKDLSKLYFKISSQLARFKIMFGEQTNIIFPEIEAMRSLRDSRGIKDLLVKYPSPKHLADATPEEIQKVLSENLKRCGRNNLDFAKKIKETAIDSVGVKDFPVSCYKYTIKIIQFFQGLVDEIKDKMLIGLMETPYYKLIDIECYDFLTVAKIAGEVGDIRRFPNHKKFVSYCGLDISEKQSGSAINGNRHITRRGNKILRSSFYMLSFVHISKKKKLYPFYQRLKEKGKHSKQAITACARKFAVWTYYEMTKCHQ